MKWFSRHISTTAWLAYLVSFTAISILAWVFPLPLNIAYVIALFSIGTWVLLKKGRSLKNLWWGVVFVVAVMYGQSSGGYAYHTYSDLSSYVGEQIGSYMFSLVGWTCLHSRKVSKGGEGDTVNRTSEEVKE